MRATVRLGKGALCGEQKRCRVDQRATTWPAALPCERFDRLDFSGGLSAGYRVEWYLDSGAPLRFTLPRLKQMPDHTLGGRRSFALDSSFPAVRLKRLRM